MPTQTDRRELPSCRGVMEEVIHVVVMGREREKKR